MTAQQPLLVMNVAIRSVARVAPSIRRLIRPQTLVRPGTYLCDISDDELSQAVTGHIAQGGSVLRYLPT